MGHGEEAPSWRNFPLPPFSALGCHHPFGSSKDGVEAQEGNRQKVGEEKEPIPLSSTCRRLGFRMVRKRAPQEPQGGEESSCLSR